jgi:hypothetical protein
MIKLNYFLGCGSILGVAGLLSCAAVDAERPVKPIAPAGGAANLVKPTTVFECASIDEYVSFLIQRGSDSCVEKLTAFENTTCQGEGQAVPAEKGDPRILFVGPLSGRDGCPESLTVRTGSPCRIYESSSGGNIRKVCLHEGRFVDLRHCLNHTGICASHP